MRAFSPKLQAPNFPECLRLGPARRNLQKLNESRVQHTVEVDPGLFLLQVLPVNPNEAL